MLFLTFLVALIEMTMIAYSSPLKNVKAPSDRHMHTSEWVQYFNNGDQGPGNYLFSYDHEDSDSNNLQFREERNENGTVVGSYGKMGADGKMKIVHYVSDKKGYRTKEESIKTPDLSTAKTVLHEDILKKLNKNKKLQDNIMARTSATDGDSFLKGIPLNENAFGSIPMPELMNIKSQSQPEFDLLFNIYPHDGKRMDLKKLTSNFDTGNYYFLHYPFKV